MKRKPKHLTAARITLVLLALLTAFAMMPAVPSAVYAEDDPPVVGQSYEVPTANITYDQNHDWVDTLEIDSDMTIKISGVTHENTGISARPAILIKDGAHVNLVLEGTNVLSAAATGGAGIQVEDGASVSIYGTDGARLTVTGGQNGAGIGGQGYGTPAVGNLPCGTINIYSGTITAIGGDRGAGIGSGYHQSASDINICGGDITALGTECGAGIGSGYGTSGGQGPGAGVGFYHGGNITISGGKVRAAGWHVDFDDFDPYDPASMYDGEYSNYHAAGIGGGYGASSGHIIIEGDADVTALGCSGGAGIGCGRGTLKENNYDFLKADCDVTIRGQATVVAMAAKDTRANQTPYSGAGIGLGHRWALENGPQGTVEIQGNATVYAYADGGANGIGAGTIVGATLAPAHLMDLTIGPDCTVVAVSDEAAEFGAIDSYYVEYYMDPALLPPAELTFDEEYFTTAAVGTEEPFFTEEKFPVKVAVGLPGEADPRALFSLSHAGTINVAVMLPVPDEPYYKIKDYGAADGTGVLLAQTNAGDGWRFGNGKKAVAALQYEEFPVTYNLNGGTNSAKNPAAYKVYGPAVKLASPTRSGYNFDGWYTNAKFTGSKVTTLPADNVGSKELWAKWKAKVAGTQLVKMTAKGKTSLVISWNKITGAEGYDIFFAKCSSGKDKTAIKKIKTIKGNKTFTWTKTGLKKGVSYKTVVKAWVMKDGKKTYVRTSPMAHAYTNGGNATYTNPKSISVKTTSVTLKVGKTHTVKASVAKLKSNKKLMRSTHVAKLRYKSSSNKVATVSTSGKITAKGKGTCKVYVYTANGLWKTITVTVK